MRVVCGPFPALESAFLSRLKELGPGPSKPVAVVAPSGRLSERLQRLAALDGALSLLGVRFHTFHSLAAEVLGSAGGPSKTYVGDGLFHDKIIDRILAETGARPSRGLAAAYRSSLRDLIDAGVDPAQFGEHLKGLIPDGDERRRVEALVLLQGRYLERLASAGILPPSGLAREAAAAAAAGRAAALDRYAEILYYGFYDLTGTQADFFEAVTGQCESTVFFPYRKGHPAFAFADRFFKVKLGRSKAAHVEPREPGALADALDALFVPGTTSAARPAGLRLYSASGARDEAWIAAKEILALREGPSPPEFSSIGVVARTLDPYRSAITQVFRENAIPFWLGSSGPLLRHPAAKRMLALLLLRRREFPARVVLDLVQSPDFKPAGRGARRLAGTWTTAVRRLGIHSGWLQWEGRLGSWTKEDLPLGSSADGPSLAKEELGELLGWLRAVHAALAGPPGLPADPWPAMAAHARRVVEETFDEPRDPEALAAWEAALECVDSLAAFGPAAPDAGWQDFLDALEEKLRRAALPAAVPNGGVRVLDAMDARGDSFEHLFLLGLQERVFPRQVREDPLLPDAARARLEHPGGYWILPKLQGYSEERLLFTLLAGSAAKTLHAVFPRSNDEGRAQVPSIYLRELCRAAGVELESAERVPRRPLEKLASIPESRLAPKEAALLLAQEGRSAAALLEPLGIDGGLLDSCVSRLPELSRRGEPGPFDGVIGAPAEWLQKASERGFSPTGLEDFVRCPFQFFAARVLGLGEVEEPSERGELAPDTRGRLAHEALERFHRRLAETGFWKQDGDWAPELERALEETFGPRSWREFGVYPVVWEATQRRLKARIRALAALDVRRIRETGLVPSGFEREISAPVAGARLRGRLDRLDMGADGGVWIVDYKLGRAPEKLLGDLTRKGSLQPPLYLELAVSAGLADADLARGAALYCLEDSARGQAEPSIVSFSGEEWRAARRRILEVLGDNLGRIGRGEFFIVRSDGPGGACQWCSFASVCRRSHAPTLARAEDSELRTSFDLSRKVSP